MKNIHVLSDMMVINDKAIFKTDGISKRKINSSTSVKNNGQPQPWTNATFFRAVLTSPDKTADMTQFKLCNIALCQT